MVSAILTMALPSFLIVVYIGGLVYNIIHSYKELGEHYDKAKDG
jgi:hypothetical protein